MFNKGSFQNICLFIYWLIVTEILKKHSIYITLNIQKQAATFKNIFCPPVRSMEVAELFSTLSCRDIPFVEYAWEFCGLAVFTALEDTTLNSLFWIGTPQDWAGGKGSSGVWIVSCPPEPARRPIRLPFPSQACQSLLTQACHRSRLTQARRCSQPMQASRRSQLPQAGTIHGSTRATGVPHSCWMRCLSHTAWATAQSMMTPLPSPRCLAANCFMRSCCFCDTMSFTSSPWGCLDYPPASWFCFPDL